MLRKIYLHQSLNKLAPEPIEVAVNDCYELVRYLKAFVPGFWRAFKQLDRVVFIRKSKGEYSAIEKEELTWRLGDAEEIHLTPAVEGAGLEVGTAAWYAVNIVVSLAVSYAVSYILQSMQETPETEDLKPDQSSTIFNGGKTLDRQGQRVPLVYGRCMANGVRVNISYEAVDASLGQSDYISLTFGESARVNVFANDKSLVAPTLVNITIDDVTTPAGTAVSAFYGYVTILANANGDITITSTKIAGVGARIVVDVYATDNGLSIPQKLYVDIHMVPYNDVELIAGSVPQDFERGGL